VTKRSIFSVGPEEMMRKKKVLWSHATKTTLARVVLPDLIWNKQAVLRKNREGQGVLLTTTAEELK
jgi:hypothetical protein